VQGVADEDCRPGAQTATEKKVEARAVWKRGTHCPFAARSNFALLVFPPEGDVAMTTGKAERW
jgi:hypothetical protein